MAIDYEFQIRRLQRELAHLEEMQGIMQSHQDAHDRSFEAVGSRLNRIEEILEKLALAQAVTEQKLQTLIDVLVREHGNGKKS